MSLLIPLGLLGLLGLVALLIIYFIKPNYQQKFVSSTFIWKRSLKYRKKRIPINKLRNLLILLCQILILALLAFLLAQPVILDETDVVYNEKVVVIDASASMLATARYDEDHYTRFEAAVDEVIELADETFEKDGLFTVILAGEKSETLFSRVGADSEDEVMSKLAEMKSARDSQNENIPLYCTYGTADIEGAMTIAENITVTNPRAEVLLYTGKQYLNSNGVKVVDMSRGASEVNVAILDVRAALDEGYYTFYADVVSYGENAEVDISWLIDVDIYKGESESGYVMPVTETVHKNLVADEVVTVIFDTNSQYKADGSQRPVVEYVAEYVSATASVVFEGDALVEDNSVTLYGGVRPRLNVQYASPTPTKFWFAALSSFADATRKRWDIHIDEVRGTGASPKTEGYDLYLFEHRIPSTLPADGVVFLINPTALPGELGVRLGNGVSGANNYLSAPNEHPLNKYMNLDRILVTSFNAINTYPQGYETVMQCNGRPVFISKKDNDEKIAIMTFSVNYSDFALRTEFPTLVYNMFEYFLPSTFSQFIFDVNDSIALNARGESLELTGIGVNEKLTDLPAEYKLTKVGTYTTKQQLVNASDPIIENFFVKIPSAESNIFLTVDIMPGSVIQPLPAISFDDLLVYFAAALVVLVLLERALHSFTKV